MHIKDVDIQGFGVWHDLQIQDLNPALTVFYGPNEAGKSTIMQFLRAMLYGFTPARRAKYLPPLRGGKAGGRLGLHHERETWNLRRFDSNEQGLGPISLVGSDEHEHGDAQLRHLLSEVDESTYSNVFSLSLHELQELSTLQETDAGRLLYEMSAGLDRVSLGDVLRELHTSRSRLLSNGERPSQITDLLTQRDRLRAELDQLAAGWRGRRRLSDERQELERSIQAATQEQNVLSNELRSAETAWSLRDMWLARASLNDELNSIGPTDNVPTDAVERMDHANSVLRRCKSRRRKLLKRRDTIKKQYDAIVLNQNLWKHAPRILALTEHEPWLAALDQQNRDAKNQASNLEKKLSALRTQLGVNGDIAPVAHESMGRRLSGVLSVAKQLRQAAIRLKDAKNLLVSNRGTRDESQIEIDELLSARGETSLTAALDKTGQEVSVLRRRVHLDERLDQMARSKADLEFDLREYADMQMIPGWALVSLGAMFVFGAGLIITAFFMPGTRAINWPFIIVGTIVAGISTMIKSHLEYTSTRKAEGCQKQLTLITRQIEQAEAERAELDQQLPESAGSLVSRLETAEFELARLEELVPLESRRVSTHQESLSVRERLKSARSGYEKARKRWVAALAAAKLPETWSPTQVKELAKQYGDLGHLYKEYENSQQDQERRLREAASLKARVEQLFVDTNVTPESTSLLEQIRQLRRDLATHETKTAEQADLKTTLIKYKRKLRSYDRTLHRYEKQRETLLRSVHALDETDFRSRVQKYLQLADLTRRRDSYNREIHAAIQGFCSEDDLIRWFKSGSRENLETRLPELRTRSTAVQERLRQLFEKRGALQQQAKLAIEDRRFAQKQLELNILEQKIQDASNRWRSLTVTHSLLDNLKLEYERNRQPETLREASEYLSRFTGGQYQRVWTPLGESRLCVDDHHGNNVPVEVLSRGTREQLFLSLRLALTSWYARKGKRLPIVLDDVLVNFDNTRAEAAASLLRDFADKGHQLLLFTCHEHIGRIFKKLDVDVRQLPAQETPDRWPVFELPDVKIETRVVEVIKEVVREVPRDIEPIKTEVVEAPIETKFVEVEPVVQPAARRRRRRVTEQVIEQPVEIVERPAIPTVVVQQPSLAIQYDDRTPQPKPQPAYNDEATVVYRAEATRVAPPAVVTVYEPQPAPAVVYEAVQPRPAPVYFERPIVNEVIQSVPQRVDQPRQEPPQPVMGTWVPQKVRWNAEEFDGELDDQVRRQARQRRQAAERAAAQQVATTNQSRTTTVAQPVLVETQYAQPVNTPGSTMIAGVSELRTTGINTQGVTVYEQGTPARQTYVQELGRPVTRYATNGGSTTRRRVRVTETVTIDPQTNEEIVTETWSEPINETNAERIERVRYYDAEIDDE